MQRLTLKSSTIFISVGEKTRVYRSVAEVPPNLRRKLEESTNSLNSATILIADRKGRQEIVKALQGLPSGVRGRMAGSLLGSVAKENQAAKRSMNWKSWAEILLPGAVGLLIWLAFNFR
jgi:hypothetical protein